MIVSAVVGISHGELTAQVSPTNPSRGVAVNPVARPSVGFPIRPTDPADCLGPHMRPASAGQHAFPPANEPERAASPAAALRCLTQMYTRRRCISFASSNQRPSPLLADAFVRDSVSWAPVFQHLIWSLLGDMHRAREEGTLHPWRVVVPYPTPEWERFAKVLRVGLRATTPQGSEQHVDQIIVDPLQIEGDSGTMRIVRVVAMRRTPRARAVTSKRSEYFLLYFVRANCWQFP